MPISSTEPNGTTLSAVKRPAAKGEGANKGLAVLQGVQGSFDGAIPAMARWNLSTMDTLSLEVRSAERTLASTVYPSAGNQLAVAAKLKEAEKYRGLLEKVADARSSVGVEALMASAKWNAMLGGFTAVVENSLDLAAGRISGKQWVERTAADTAAYTGIGVAAGATCSVASTVVGAGLVALGLPGVAVFAAMGAGVVAGVGVAWVAGKLYHNMVHDRI